MRDREAINLDDKFTRFGDHWSPRIIARLNDLHVKAVKVRGEFVWHRHDDTDELFVVHRGVLTVRYRDGEVKVGPGELHVVPKGAEHITAADDECEILIFEPAGTVNTGDAGGDLTATEEPWI